MQNMTYQTLVAFVNVLSYRYWRPTPNCGAHAPLRPVVFSPSPPVLHLGLVHCGLVARVRGGASIKGVPMSVKPGFACLRGWLGTASAAAAAAGVAWQRVRNCMMTKRLQLVGREALRVLHGTLVPASVISVDRNEND